MEFQSGLEDPSVRAKVVHLAQGMLEGLRDLVDQVRPPGEAQPVDVMQSLDRAIMGGLGGIKRNVVELPINLRLNALTQSLYDLYMEYAQPSFESGEAEPHHWLLLELTGRIIETQGIATRYKAGCHELKAELVARGLLEQKQ